MFVLKDNLKTITTVALLTLSTITVGAQGTFAATFGTSHDGPDQDLQDLLDGITSGVNKIDTVNDQSDVELWTYTGDQGFSSTLLFEVAGNANFNSFGIYKQGDTDTFLELFSGADKPSGSDFSTAVEVDLTALANIGDTFGFYLNDRHGNFFYTQDSLNKKGEQAIAYQGSGDVSLLNDPSFDENDWIIAFEDILLHKSDSDYNDLVVHVTGLTGVIEVPEPTTLLGLGLMTAAGLAFRRRQS